MVGESTNLFVATQNYKAGVKYQQYNVGFLDPFEVIEIVEGQSYACVAKSTVTV